MNLIKREPSPAQSEASRANGRLSNGPRTERGKEVSSRNLPKLRPFAEVVARSMQALDENPQEFEQMHQALADAMAPRDAWEAAWVQDIAVLRWRLERLQRAEAGVLAARRRKPRSRTPPRRSAPRRDRRPRTQCHAGHRRFHRHSGFRHEIRAGP